jgi:hypothetical protein
MGSLTSEEIGDIAAQATAQVLEHVDGHVLGLVLDPVECGL